MREVLSGLAAVAMLLVTASGVQAGPITYTYDVLGRVTSATYPNGDVVSYQYDRAGNRTQRTQTGTLARNAPPPSREQDSSQAQPEGRNAVRR